MRMKTIAFISTGCARTNRGLSRIFLFSRIFPCTQARSLTQETPFHSGARTRAGLKSVYAAMGSARSAAVSSRIGMGLLKRTDSILKARRLRSLRCCRRDYSSELTSWIVAPATWYFRVFSPMA